MCGSHCNVAATGQLLSAQNLPKPEGARKDSEIIDPYVNIHVLGIQEDCCKVHSRVINDNGQLLMIIMWQVHDMCLLTVGFNPCWDEHFTFTINFPELAFVRFVVLDSDPGKDDFIGQYTIPFESMEHGKVWGGGENGLGRGGWWNVYLE